MRTLRSPIRVGERILMFGVSGTRKTSSALDIARRCVDAKFYVLDNEGQSYERLLWTEYVDVAERGNYEIENVWMDEWEPYVPTIQRWRKTAGANDWLVVDSITRTWPAVQSWYYEQVFGAGTSAHLMELRKAARDEKDYKKNLAIDNAWDVINPSYMRLYTEIMKWPGHVYLVADQKEYDAKNATKEQQANYSILGVMPAGQKQLPNIPQTVLHAEKNRAGVAMLTTVKDRGRESMSAVAVEDFATDYLVAVAGWKIVKIDDDAGAGDES